MLLSRSARVSVTVSSLLVAALFGANPAAATEDANENRPATSVQASTAKSKATLSTTPRSDHRRHDLRRADLRKKNLHHSKFHHAKLHRSNLSKAKLHHSSFRHATLHRATVHRTNFRHTDMRDASMLNLNGQHADFSHARMHRVRLDRATLHHVRFRNAVLHKASLKDLTARRADFRGVKAKHARFHRANLTRADFSGADLTHSRFGKAKIRKANFASTSTRKLSALSAHGAILVNTSFVGADLSGSDLSGADLTGANLRNANLTNANLRDANLTNADLTGAILTGADLTGAIITGADFSAGGSGASRSFCTNYRSGSSSSTTIRPGIVALNYSSPSRTGSGTITLQGPNDMQLQATYKCQLPQIERWRPTIKYYDFTITVTGVSNGFTSPVTGLSVDSAALSGTITSRSASTAKVEIRAAAAMQADGMAMRGTFRMIDSSRWLVDLDAVSGSLSTSDGTYQAVKVDGSITNLPGRLAGSLDVDLAGNQPWLDSLPQAWSKFITYTLSVAEAGSNVHVTHDLVLRATNAKGGNVSHMTLTADLANTVAGFHMDADGVLYLGDSPMRVSGRYESAGYRGAADPSWEIQAQITDAPISDGAVLTSGTLSATDANPGFTGTAEIDLTGTSHSQIGATIDYTDSLNWSLDVAGGNSTAWSPDNLTSLKIPANAFNGSVTVVDGNATWNMDVGSASNLIQWKNLATGVTHTSWFRLGNTCPLAGCGDATGLFLSVQDGTLSITDPAVTVQTSGAVLADGTWATITAGVDKQVSFDGPLGASLTLGNPELVVWKGDSAPETVAGLQMPDVNKSGSGLGVQFCGDFAATDVPYIGSTADTQGCASWSPGGVIFAAKNLGVDGGGGTATAQDSDDDVSDVQVSGSTFDGIAWTNLATKPVVTIDDIAIKALPNTTELTGTVTVPGTVASALGKSAQPLTMQAQGSFSDDSWNLEDASFDVRAQVDLGYSSNGFTLDDFFIEVGKSGPSYSFELGVDATYVIDGHADPVSLTLGLDEGVMTLALTATGSGADNDACACDGVNGEFATPEGYNYLTSSFMDVPGMHLWSITGQLVVAEGEPGFGIGATVYQDPTKMSAIMQGTTWMQANFYVNLDLLDPCLDFSFQSSDPDTYLQVKGGILRTSDFAISIAEAKGCTVGNREIPGGIAVNFDAAFGSKSSVAFSLALDPAAETFYESVYIEDVDLGGITFDGDLVIDLKPASQQVNFDADFTMAPAGDFAADYALNVNSSGDIVMTGNVNATDWDLAGGTFDVQSFTYYMNFDTGAGTFNSNASGQMSFSARSNLAFTADIAYANGALTQLDFDFDYQHGGIGTEYILEYDAAAHSLSGGVDFTYTKRTSHRFTSGGHNYVRHAYITISLWFYMNTNNPSQGTLAISFSGTSSDGDLKVSGGATLSSVPGTDDSAWASLHVHIPSMGSWDDSWSW